MKLIFFQELLIHRPRCQSCRISCRAEEKLGNYYSALVSEAIDELKLSPHLLGIVNLSIHQVICLSGGPFERWMDSFYSMRLHSRFEDIGKRFED